MKNLILLEENRARTIASEKKSIPIIMHCALTEQQLLVQSCNEHVFVSPHNIQIYPYSKSIDLLPILAYRKPKQITVFFFIYLFTMHAFISQALVSFFRFYFYFFYFFFRWVKHKNWMSKRKKCCSIGNSTENSINKLNLPFN